ncbi:JmjC domain-containing protein [Embleya sp. NPDC001921]
MSEPAVECELDWRVFADQYWDRRPVLFRNTGTPPFVEGEVFTAAVKSQAATNTNLVPLHTSLTIEREWQREAGGFLPVVADGSFEGYERRLGHVLAGRCYALMFNIFHAFDFSVWMRERDFFESLWRRVGMPVSGAITTLFHGNYDSSPVGVHKDNFATFMFGLRGRKRMRFWSHRPWSEEITTKTDYRRYIGESFAVEVGPGDLLYWPASYYHVGETVGRESATSVNVGVPRGEHQFAHDVDALLIDLDADRMAENGFSISDLLPAVRSTTASGPDAYGYLSSSLPPPLGEALEIFREFGHTRNLEARLQTLSLRRWTAVGFEPPPSPRAGRRLADGVIIRGEKRSPIRFVSLDDESCAFGANGHSIVSSVPATRMKSIIEDLNSGKEFQVGNLVHSISEGISDRMEKRACAATEVRELLERLESFRAIARVRE